MSVMHVSEDKISEISSKGSQEKWFDDGRWYKLDQYGYEALAETLISVLLERSNIEKETPFSFVRYQMERVNVHGYECTGCSSEDLLAPGQSIITLSHLFKRAGNIPLEAVLARQPSDKRRIEYLAEATAELTGLELFPQYLTLLFEVDGLFHNDGRDMNNIAVLEQDGKYDYCPIFNNGAGLLSNTQTLSMLIDPKALATFQLAKPFNISFNRQVGAVQSLYGCQLRMPKLTREELCAELEPLLPYYAERDRIIITARVCDTILLCQK